MKNNILIMPIQSIHIACQINNQNNNQKKSVYKVKQSYDNNTVASFKDLLAQKIKEQRNNK